MSRRIEECNVPPVYLHAVSTDMLRDAARFARGNIRMANGIEQGGLAVVDVAHNNHDRRPGNKILIVVLAVVDNTFFDGDDDFLFYLRMELHSDKRRRIEINYIVDRNHGTHHKQLLDDLGRRCLQAQRQFADGNFVRDGYGNRLAFTLCRNSSQALRLSFLTGIARPAPLLGTLRNLLLLDSVFRLDFFRGKTVVFLVVPVDINDDLTGIYYSFIGLSLKRYIVVCACVLLGLLLRTLLLCRAGRICPLLGFLFVLLGRGLLLCAFRLLLRRLFIAPESLKRLFLRLLGALLLLLFFAGPFLRMLLDCAIPYGEVLVKAFGRHLLGIVIEHDIELILVQCGHMFLGLSKVLF